MRVSDFVFGMFFVVFGAAVLAYALQLPAMPGQRYGAGTFPSVLGAAFMVGGGILAWRGFASGELKSRLVAIAPWVRDRYLLTNVVIALALIIAYVLLDDYVGFAPLAFAILMVLFLRFGVRPLRGAVIAAFTVLFIHLTFVTLLRVPLPGGLIDRLLW